MYILAIDQGTTGTTAALIDANTFKFVNKVNKEFPQHYPKPSWVEHDLNDIWNTVETTITELIKKSNINTSDIKAIGITNQRETTCAIDTDGNPVHKAIVWQDRRTSSFCEELISNGHKSSIQNKTGLPIDAYFSATKMRWLNKELNDPTVRFCTIDTFLLNKLTNNNSFYTEPSNASRTMLYNIHTANWDNELCDLFNVNQNQLPLVKNSFDQFGKTNRLSFLPDGIPITGILGDQQSALFGQAGYNKGDLKCTYGTGAFMLLNTGSEAVSSKNGLLTTVAYGENGKLQYALEGSTYIAGAAVQWLRDNLNLFENAPEIENLANQVSNLEEMEHVLFLPFFTGIGSPHWKSDAKAAIIGLTRDTNKSHLSRACLEGIAFSINDLVSAFENDSGEKIQELKVDGGAVANNLLMNMQSSLSKLEIIRPEVIETTAYGAALAAAIGNGLIEKEKIEHLWKKDQSFTPDSDLSHYFESKNNYWKNSIEKLF